MGINLQSLYANGNDGAQLRPSFLNPDDARRYYRKYLQFVSHHVPVHHRLLDVGCGSGWSSYLLADRGYEVVGVDLNAKAFQPPSRNDLNLREGSVLDLPFAEKSFDAVSSYQCLEHVPNPAKALSEIRRVLRPGGVVVFVGPNLLSLGSPVRGLCYYSWRQRPLRRILFRFADTPKHPAGNTVLENIGSLVWTLAALLHLACTAKYHFRMREPDLRPPFHSDNDACWRTNPIEMTRALRSLGFEILADHELGKFRFLRHLAGGMYIAARLGLNREGRKNGKAERCSQGEKRVEWTWNAGLKFAPTI